ncbi:MAG: GH2, partial [uncultured Solirubrobacteraceae bacterium]
GRRPPPPAPAPGRMDEPQRLLGLLARPGGLPPDSRRGPLRAADRGAVRSGDPRERRRGHRALPRLLVPQDLHGPRARAGRAPVAALRRGRPPGLRVGQRRAGGRPRGRLHAVRRRHHRGAGRRRPGGRRPRLRRPRGPREAARQAGLAARAAHRLVPADHRHLADRLARGGPGLPPGVAALAAGRPRLVHRRRGLRGRRPPRRPAARGGAPPGRRGARGRRLGGPRRRGPPAHRAHRPRHPLRAPGAAVVARRAAPPRRGAARRGPGGRARHGPQLHRPALRAGRGRAAHAQRPADRDAARPRPGLLARLGLHRQGRRGHRARRRARAGPRLQRRAQAPEGRGPAVPAGGGRARPARLERDALGVPLHVPQRAADHEGVAAGRRARREPPVH